ncbi:hypothetical protein [Paenibacillus sp. FSL L8-0463]|uniref:hypothetical protein n=1 Tax=Paenibacillus sp. FSL L8-0463 TaxID=2954687 RepID=UPI003119C54E
MSSPKLSASQALNIAQEYINERNKHIMGYNKNYIPSTIDSDIDKSVQYYEDFFALTGGAWIVEIDFRDFEELLVVSDEQQVISFWILGIDRNKLPEIHTKLTTDQLLQIAQSYNDEYDLEGVIHPNHGESIFFYEKFEHVEGYSWIINMNVPPSPYGGGDMVSLVFSDEKACVEYMFDPSGYPITPHLDDD